MEIQRHPNGRLEVTLNAQDLEMQKQEIEGLEYVLRNWKDKSDEASSCSVNLVCQADAAAALKPLVENKVSELDQAFGIAVDLNSVEEPGEDVSDASLYQKKSHFKDLIMIIFDD